MVPVFQVYVHTSVSFHTSVNIASVAQLDVRPTGDQEVTGSTPAEVNKSFEEIDHEIFSTVILSLPLIQEG